MKKEILGLLGLSACMPSVGMAQEALPNFVFMMSEDVAPHFVGLYNEGRGAQTPNVDFLASEGIVFDNAYSNAPVSSAARSTMITGCYGPRLGVSFHRKLEILPLPENQHLFPAFLRQKGYFTACAAKHDYNCKMDDTAWDIKSGVMGDWRKRPNKNQPFLFVRTNGTSHEGHIQFIDHKKMVEHKTFHSPDEVKVLPMHPDTELFRYTYAAFYDNIRTVDTELGEMIKMLREDGLLDNTFIFYMGDNGGSLPASKGYTTEVGLRVPLVVYVPKAWRDKLPIPAKSHVNGIVSFMDLGPTLLHMAGIEIPEYMDGTPFLGEDITLDKVNKRDEVYGYGDRFDELYAFNRTVRKGNFKYSRNFLPYHPKSLYSQYRYQQNAFWEWKELFEAGKLNEVQSAFFLPQGPEELYDLEKDPNETRNLAKLPEYQKELKKLRKLLFAQLKDKNDLGLLPENIWLTEGIKSPGDYAKASHKRISDALETANLQLLSYAEGHKKALNALESTDPVQRYWGLTACIYWGKEAKPLADKIQHFYQTEKEPFLRARALVYLAEQGIVKNGVEDFKAILAAARCGAESMGILNDMAFMKEQHPSWVWNMKVSDIKKMAHLADWRINYLNK